MAVTRQLDEDEWVVPDSWWADTDRFRGRGPARPVPLDEQAEHGYARVLTGEQARGDIRELLENTAAQGRIEIAAAGTAAFEATHESPLGAAVLALGATHATRRRLGLTTVLDAWIARHGMVFAAEAAVRLCELFVPRDVPHVRPVHAAVGYPAPYLPMLSRLRSLLADVPESDYRAVVALLSGLRAAPGTMSIRMATSYLLPTEQNWVEADLFAAQQNQLRPDDAANLRMLASVTTVEQLRVLGWPAATLSWAADLRTTLIAHIGPEVAPLLAEAFDAADSFPDRQRELANALACLPTDAAFEILLERADRGTVRGGLQDAVTRYPRRALRLMAANGSRSRVITGLLHAQAHMYPELAAELGIEPEPAPSTVAYHGIATREQLPEFLRTPPWQQPKPATDEVVLPGIGTVRPIELHWREGEQRQWADTPNGFAEARPDASAAQDWEGTIAGVVANPVNSSWTLIRVFASAPPELIAPHLDLLRPEYFWRDVTAMMRLLGRFGDRVLPVILAAVRQDIANRAEVLAPITGTEITTIMTGLLGKPKTARIATPWLERHLSIAAPDLIAAALGKPARPRRNAWAALHLLSRRGHRDALLAAAAGYGQQAVAALDAELITDPLRYVPDRIPALPSWLIPGALPPIVLRDSRTALDAAAVATACTMLAIAEQQGGYAGVAEIKKVADPRSLAEFAWALMDPWRAFGYPPGEGWVLRALAEFGDDDAARKLTPLIRIWPGESAHQRAVRGLDVLAAIGTDIALMQLNGIAEKVKFNGIKSHARAMIEQIARERGLTPEQLADRLVPDLGLRADGTLSLDYGPRAFRIGLDEQLRPTVSDADGAPRKSLPKPGATDDPELAPAAQKAFTAFKKDVKAVAGIQLRRFEDAMVRGRRWSAAEHRQLFIEHPLVGQLSRRLVWASFDADGAVTGSFRVAEDGSLANAHDDALTLPADATVGVAHPLHLGDARTAWGEIFADYELLQPFPQLNREIYRLTDAEAAAGRLERFEGIAVPAGNPMRLVTRGWERETPQDNGDINCLFRVLGGGRSIVVCLEPGYSAAMPPDIRGDKQEFDRVWLGDTGDEHRWWRDRATYPFGVLDPVTVSELLRDLEYVFA